MHDKAENQIAGLAKISSMAKIGKNVTVKDWAVIEDDVQISDNCELHYNVRIENGTRLSSNIKVYNFSCLGIEPNDLKYRGEKTYCEIGDNTIIKEFCTVSRGTNATGKTIIGKNCYLMAYVHIAHDSIIGDNVIFGNAANLGGHVTIEDWAIVGGLLGIHQFTRIGRHSFTAFLSRVTQDVPPYILAAGTPLAYKGLNIVGLRRRGFSVDKIENIKEAYRYIYGKKYNTSDALKAVRDNVKMTEEVTHIVEFIERSERGIIRGIE
jgi:UDP-N-acetylglucosamine acyltransferase